MTFKDYPITRVEPNSASQYFEFTATVAPRAEDVIRVEKTGYETVETIGGIFYSDPGIIEMDKLP